MNIEPVISVIVPVYNVAHYLRQCINSVLSQNYNDWELLLVDDGSTDGSGKICDEYARKDRRIIVRHKENGGVSSSRNVGLKMAKGKWIFFLDSDDELYPFALNDLINWANGADMVAGKMFIKEQAPESKKTKALNRPKKKSNHLISPTKYVRAVADSKYCIVPAVFPKLFRRDIIESNDLIFDEHIYYAEDQLFIVQYLCCKEVKSVYFNNVHPVYVYNIRKGSAMSQYDVYSDKLLTDFVGFMKIYETFATATSDKKVINWAKKNAYISGQHLLRLMNQTENVPETSITLVRNGLETITNGGKDFHLIEGYCYHAAFVDMTKTISSFASSEEQIAYINKWLHSDKCALKYLNRKWKVIYILSRLFGKIGVRLIYKIG